MRLPQNFAGCLLWACFLTYLSRSFEEEDKKLVVTSVALKKAFEPWFVILVKGAGANFMVCLGVWQSVAAGRSHLGMTGD
jgi:formate/nitrite transporter FocA (FNT family)